MRFRRTRWLVVLAATGLAPFAAHARTPQTPPPPTVTAPVSRMSREDAPTRIWLLPEALVQAPFQYWKLRASSVTVTRWVWPGLRLTLVKPRRFFGGSPVLAGCPM